jgi:hypothetical protein
MLLLPTIALFAACGDSSSSNSPDQDGGPPADTGTLPSDTKPPPNDTPPPDVSSDSGDLPSGDTGIASHHPSDVGIGSDPDVIFADDFEGETDVASIDAKWGISFNNRSITTNAANVHRGAKALEFFSPKQTAELSNGVAHEFTPELDRLFLRWYSKFDTTFDVVGSSHNGGGINAHYFLPDGSSTPGVPANGTNKFLVEYECWRGDATAPNPGSLNAYVYWPEQRSNYGDHFFPDGTVLPNTSIPGNFGPTFVSRPQVTPELGRWYAFELMVQANTPGARDGRIVFWLDGKIIADFPNLRFRDVATLTINRFGLSLHIGSNPNAATHKWYDDVVAAKSYIGPVYGP